MDWEKSDNMYSWYKNKSESNMNWNKVWEVMFSRWHWPVYVFKGKMIKNRINKN